MGRGGRHRARSQRKHFKEGRENVWKRPKSDSDNPATENATWASLVTENPSFEEYYKEQGIVAPEEWDGFMEMLRKPLPAAFRINSNSQFCDDIRSKLENDFMKSLQAETVEGGDVEAIKPLPWYPKNLAWHTNFSRKQIRKTQTLERFHEFLKLENEVGSITRQEAVSMVPPLFLDVHPDHVLLDMCAAPGSKTFQLLEIIHQSSEPGALPNGMVVANDPDFQRSNLLIHQTKRMCTANLIVTNHDGQQFPSCRLNKSLARTSGIPGEPDMDQLLFDRVLCDVPCSGDGTLRKAPDIWRKWNSGMGNGLHSLQVLLAMRGLSVLKIGGRMVYSTCSMNPVEDEAVVAEVLRRCGESVELLDVSSELPELVRRPGLRKWKVRDKGLWLASYNDVRKHRRNGILPSMFPSGKSYKDSIEDGNKNAGNGEDASYGEGCDSMEEEVSDLPLERCMRIVPHDQNTGGFFVAVLRKVSPLPAVQEKPGPRRSSSTRNGEQSEKTQNDVSEGKDEMEVDTEKGNEEKCSEENTNAESTDDQLKVEGTGKNDTNNENITDETQKSAKVETESGSTGSKRKVPMQGKWKGFDPVVFLKDEAIMNGLKSFYGIDESFPLEGHLVTRNSDMNSIKRIYYVSKTVKSTLLLNFAVGQQLKISSVGLKMFERQSSREGSSVPCSFRISSEGLPIILPYITKQILHASLLDFKHLLQYKSIKFSDFVGAKFGEEASNLMMGCCVVVLSEGGGSSVGSGKVDKATIAIGCWRGKASLSVMVTSTDCQELLERLADRLETANGALPEGQNGDLVVEG